MTGTALRAISLICMSVDWKQLADGARVEPGTRVKLHRDFDPGYKDDLGKDAGNKALAEAKKHLFELQDRFYASADRSMLVVLQAIDAAGKDSTIKHVMSGMNPQGVDVYSFKAPSSLEASHDWLWRHQIAAPALGRIAVFNRSHYENVTVTRVHPEMLWPKAATLHTSGIWARRFDQINNWERHLTENGTVVVKLFLNVSKKEQGKRFLERIDRPEKNWKFSPTDLAERERWDDYQHAFSEMLTHTSTDYAPWYVVPADHKWFSRLTTLSILLETLTTLDPHYPEVDEETRAALEDARASLVAES